MNTIYLDNRICEVDYNFTAAYSTFKLIEQLTSTAKEKDVKALRIDLVFAINSLSDLPQIISDMSDHEMKDFPFKKAFLANKAMGESLVSLSRLVLDCGEIKQDESELYRTISSAIYSPIESLRKAVNIFDDLIINQKEMAA